MFLVISIVFIYLTYIAVLFFRSVDNIAFDFSSINQYIYSGKLD